MQADPLTSQVLSTSDLLIKSWIHLRICSAGTALPRTAANMVRKASGGTKVS
jgi:hypothetical protein